MSLVGVRGYRPLPRRSLQVLKSVDGLRGVSSKVQPYKLSKKVNDIARCAIVVDNTDGQVQYFQVAGLLTVPQTLVRHKFNLH